MMKNSATGYGWVAIVLHGIMALGIFFVFGLGLYMVELTYYDTWYRGSLELHKSLGLVLLALWFGRVAWRWYNTAPAMSGTGFEKKAAHLMHRGLYLIMLLLMVTGYFISTADGRSISVFGLLDVPAIPFNFDNQEDIAGDIHWALSWILMLMVALHALAAMKHQWIEKDGTLMKIIKP